MLVWVLAPAAFAAAGAGGESAFPRPLESYGISSDAGLMEVLRGRIQAEPFNAVATVLFFLAIIHTFMAPIFLRISHRIQHRHEEALKAAGRNPHEEVSFRAKLFHFLGEIEAIFGIWVLPLLVAVTIYKGWPTARDYIGHGVNFTEPLFVIVIMTIAASRPVLKLAEQLMASVARIGGGTPGAWWIAILTIGPLLGSFITEPAAMTISALLLAQKFYDFKPSSKFAYATLGLLFVNVSVGGTLTHFAAPPVLMVAGAWKWGLSHMLLHFGWKAAIGVVIANSIYFFWFRREFKAIQAEAASVKGAKKEESVPAWITAVHLLFLAWTVLNNHFPALFLGGFLFYLAFLQATEHQQGPLSLRSPLLVGFFLAGLVVHGGLQAWWIEPVLGRLDTLPLFFGATFLTAFNDNAAITYLASLVPNFSDAMKYAVVSGAVVGGGLTVIANAPNPAGQSILSKYFPEGVSPLKLFLGALTPTIVFGAIFLILR
jgi:Na+/H+ antiporter NhaD and related arsenite permeases